MVNFKLVTSQVPLKRGRLATVVGVDSRKLLMAAHVPETLVGPDLVDERTLLA